MTDPARPAVSVLIPCRNERTHILGCVRSMLSQEPPPGGYEVIVLDGMSDDGTRDALREVMREQVVRVLDNPGRIVSTGLNIGIAAARGAIIIRVDAHSEYAGDYIRQCVAVLHEVRADNVGGPWVAIGTSYVERAIAAAFQSRFGSGGARGHDVAYEGPVDTVYLGCWPRDLFDRIGGFDEELVRNQDDELNLRINRAGGAVWQSTRIKSWYRPRASFSRLFKQYSQYGYWKVRVIQKHRLPASVRHLVPAAFVFTMLVLAGASLVSYGARLAAAVVGGLYVVCLVAASVATAAATGPKLLPVLPVAFACFHVGYGYGFLRGILDFVILRTSSSAAMSSITRPPGPETGHAG